MRETTGAVFDTLAQIHLVRGNHEDASRALQRSREAYGDSNRWYQWSVQALEARLALRRGDAARALARRDADRARRRRAGGVCDAGGADRRRGAAGVGPARRSRAAADGGQRPDAGGRDEQRLGRVPAAARPRACRGRARDRGVSRPRTERQRVRAARREVPGGPQLPRTREAGRPRRARGRARRAISSDALAIFESLDAQPDLAGDARRDRRRCRPRRPAPSSGRTVGRRCRARAPHRGRRRDAGAAREGRDDDAARGVRRAGGGDLHAAATGRGPRRRGRRLRRGDGALDGAAAARDRAAAASSLLVVGRRHRPRRIGAAARRGLGGAPVRAAGPAALPHALRRAAAGIRALLGARAAGGTGAGRDRAIARAAASRASSARARPCSASRISSSGSRAAT